MLNHRSFEGKPKTVSGQGCAASCSIGVSTRAYSVVVSMDW